MKRKITSIVIGLLCLIGLTSTTNAVSVNISVGDQPYYVHGPGYWEHGAYVYWMPGHWSYRHHHRVWVHGYYVRR
jgi:hypothetical protein